MGWLKGFRKKAGQIQRSIVRMYGLEPLWSDKNYENFAKEGYNQNIWVNACIKAIAEAAANVPIILYADRKKEKEIEEHELLDLLDKPNEFQSKAEFIEAYISYLLIAGNSYIDMVGPNTDTNPNSQPTELWNLRPDRVQIKPDAMDYIAGYTYTTNGIPIFRDKRQVSHIKYFHPTDDFYGLSPIEVAARGIDNANAATTWNNALMNNGARPSGAFVTEQYLQDHQYDRMKEEMEVNIKGASNAGKPLILEGGVKWEEMSLSPRDLDFVNSRKMSTLEICAAFRVPPEIVGYGEQKTYNNYKEARAAFYEDSVLPLVGKMLDKLNSDLVPKFDKRLRLDVDLTKVEALQVNKELMYERVVKAWLGGLLTKDEGRGELGYEQSPDGKGNEFVPNPKYAAMNNGNSRWGNGGNSSGSGNGRGRPPGSGSGAADPEEEKADSFFLTTKAFDLSSEEEINAYIDEIEARRGKWYPAVERRVKEVFEVEHRAVISAYNAAGEDAAMNVIDHSREKWERLLTALYVEVMEDFGGALYNDLKANVLDLETKAPKIPLERFFRVFDQAVQRFIASTVAKKVTAITETTRKKIRSIIKKEEAAGKTVADIANELDKLYLDEIIPNRTYTIARTEVIGASNAGNRYAAKQTGLNLNKTWLSTEDERTRDSHVSINGETRAMDEKYSNGLMFPGDPSGEAKEVINCRCTETYSVIK
jgi:HK97 family phage portal protein